ncbi:MAG: dihydrodipicolinate synthase family protein, partial [Gammaproteobacteria bacterium]|nr:dihydrodipicolinate synthase family protein [Gammaproteobacteria bacterium]
MMFAGSLVAIVTPMRSDGALDLEAWARLLDFHLAGGTQGIVIGGTTGESPTLGEEELRALTLAACDQVRGRLTVIAGAGTSSTEATVARVAWLSQLPIDGLLLVTPAYNRPPHSMRLARAQLRLVTSSASCRAPPQSRFNDVCRQPGC